MKMTSCLSLTVLSMLAVTALAGAAEPKPVKIYLLSGQSNMTGRAGLGELNKPVADQKATLAQFIMAPKNVEKYKFLYKDDGKSGRSWSVRDDVFITIGDWPHEVQKDQGKHGGLGPYYGGFRNKGFGPELGIGHALGNFHDEQVLLVKVAFAGRVRREQSGGPLERQWRVLLVDGRSHGQGNDRAVEKIISNQKTNRSRP